MSKVQDDRLLLRLPTSLTSATDQVIKEQLPELNRSEFIRRAVRFTIDHIEQFKDSNASTVSEKEDIESIAKINEIRDLYKQIFEYKERLQQEPNSTAQTKQLSFLIYLVSAMIFKMSSV